MHSIKNKYLKYLIQFILPGLILFFLGYYVNSCRESRKDTIVGGVKIENIVDNLKAHSDSLKQISEDFNKVSKKLDKIGDCLNREIIPALNKISQGTIQRIELSSLSKSIDENLKKYDSRLVSIQDAQEKTSFLIASSVPENLFTLNGKIKAINQETQKMEFWTYPLVAAGQDIPDKKLSLNYTTDTFIVKNDRSIVDAKAIKPEQIAELKYFKWKGNIYIKSIKILEEPQIKKK